MLASHQARLAATSSGRTFAVCTSMNLRARSVASGLALALLIVNTNKNTGTPKIRRGESMGSSLEGGLASECEAAGGMNQALMITSSSAVMTHTPLRVTASVCSTCTLGKASLVTTVH